MEEQDPCNHYDTQTLAEFYDKQEEEYRAAMVNIQKMRTLAGELGLLTRSRKEIERLAAHAMFF